MHSVDAVVIGAGVIGLAVARELAIGGLDTIIVDGEAMFGTWTSSRNSEVIHAGIYYPAGSIKAALCTRGRDLLYAYCAARHVPHRRISKLIFADSPARAPALDAIERAADAAGVTDLIRLTEREARTMEPALNCAEALLSPSTGIVDSHAYMTALLADAEAAGAIFARRTTISRLVQTGEGWAVHLAGETGAALTARVVVNAAGLGAHRVAAATEGLADEHVPKVRYARGVYFAYAGAVPFSRLIYPTPVPGGLGTHLTLDLAGTARFGPDVEWIDEIDYRVDPGRGGTFLEAARAFWPDIDPARLTPSFAGVRPKLHGPNEAAADFLIQGPERHGAAGLVNLFGIESPGLTSSLAVAEEVARLLRPYS